MLEKIIGIAKRAGDAILDVYQRPIAVNHKVDGSPVTQADLAAHRLIIDGLSSISSSIPIISEEGDIPPYDARKNWPCFWLVDPLDGTAEFVNKLDEFTVNIALIENGVPVLGVIGAPAKSVLYFASIEGGAWREFDGRIERIYSNDVKDKESVVVAISRRHASKEIEELSKRFKINQTIEAGSSLKFCLVAEGSADIYPRIGPTMEWDVAAGDCIFRSSGRYSARTSSLVYNKPALKNGSFFIGL